LIHNCFYSEKFYTPGEIVTSDIADGGVSLAERVVEVTRGYLERGLLLSFLSLMRKYNKRVLIVSLFGSSVLSPRRARDIDIIIVVDKLSSIEEKLALEQAVKRAPRILDQRRVYDIILFDEESFMENTAPGCLVSGVAGYEVLHDELGFEEIVKKLALSILEEKQVIYKKNRKLNLALYSKHLLRKK
jgi:hypothetical protein